MQYKYITCKLPSNGLIYPTKEIHLRAKTIFDIKMLLGNPVFQLKSEIDALNSCIDPNDNIDVYDLVNQDVVYLLYKLRSMSDDILKIIYKKVEYPINISDLDIKYLEEYNNEVTLPDSGFLVYLDYTPIKRIFNMNEQQKEFLSKYPEYHGDVNNTLMILNSIKMIERTTDKDHLRNILEGLSFKDSIYLINKIEEFNKLDFGVVEEVTIKEKDTGTEIKVPLQINENFFRPAP